MKSGDAAVDIALLAAVLAAWALAAWLLRWGVARAVGARPAYGAALWTVLFGAIVWAMLAVAALIALQGGPAGSGPPFAAVAAGLSWLALAQGVRWFLPDPAGVRLPWPRALAVSALPLAALWASLWGALRLAGVGLDAAAG